MTLSTYSVERRIAGYAGRIAAIALFGLVWIVPLRSQDTRIVQEPHVPARCTILHARLAVKNGELTEAEEAQPDTTRIQDALDHCRPGEAVELKASGNRRVFLSGPLQLRPAVTLLIAKGTALFGSRNPRDYDVTPGSCGVVNRMGHGCKPLLLANDAPGAAVMGDGLIDGRGGAMLLGQKQTWWDLAHEAKVRDLRQNCPRLLVVKRSDNFVLYRTLLRNSPNFHVLVESTNGFTAWGVRIDSPASARNTDGIDPSSSSNVTIAHSFIRAGDDDVAIKAGSGGPSTHISILDNHFYSGHGMSIGSETNGGVSEVLVKNLTIDGADNGIRIKSDASRGGLVHDVLYEHVCMRNVKNPVVLTPHYSDQAGHLLPEYRDLLLRNVHILTPGRYTFQGWDAAHPLGVTLDNVASEDLAASHMEAQFARVTLGPQLGNLVPEGPDVTVARAAGSAPAAPPACAGSFPPFPAAQKPASAEALPSRDTALYVSKDSTGEYHSVQDAINAAPAGGATILIAPGTYRETVVVTKPDIHLRGTGPEPASTTIVFDNSAGNSGGTLHSATMEVRGDNFSAENLTVANDWNRTHIQGTQGSQALALLVTADRALFRKVRLLGNQDTLYAGSRDCSPDGQPCTPARQYFTDCFIAGNVDFIFGDGKTYFHACEIRSTPHAAGGFITAQAKHYPAEDSGFVLDHCRLTADPGAGRVWLGRPWRPDASVVYMHTWMGDQIVPAGWREWHPGETHSLDTAFFAEFDSTGPGSHPHQREPQAKLLNAKEAAPFTLKQFFPHWEPEAALKALDEHAPSPF